MNVSSVMKRKIDDDKNNKELFYGFVCSDVFWTQEYACLLSFKYTSVVSSETIRDGIWFIWILDCQVCYMYQTDIDYIIPSDTCIFIL